MRAAVIRAAGGPEVPTVEEWPMPRRGMEENRAGGKIVIVK